MTTTALSLATFFQGSNKKLGVFYPTHYLIATFPDIATARNAERAVGMHGFSDEEVISFTGQEMLDFAKEYLEHSSLAGIMMQQLSRMFATEEVYTDHDVKLASQGAAFLAARCVDDNKKQEAWKLIEPFHPLTARYYAVSGVEHFKGEL